MTLTAAIYLLWYINLHRNKIFLVLQGDAMPTEKNRHKLEGLVFQVVFR